MCSVIATSGRLTLWPPVHLLRHSKPLHLASSSFTVWAGFQSVNHVALSSININDERWRSYSCIFHRPNFIALWSSQLDSLCRVQIRWAEMCWWVLLSEWLWCSHFDAVRRTTTTFLTFQLTPPTELWLHETRLPVCLSVGLCGRLVVACCDKVVYRICEHACRWCRRPAAQSSRLSALQPASNASQAVLDVCLSVCYCKMACQVVNCLHDLSVICLYCCCWLSWTELALAVSVSVCFVLAL